MFSQALSVSPIPKSGMQALGARPGARFPAFPSRSPTLPVWRRVETRAQADGEKKGLPIGQRATLATGDLASLVLFVYIGRASHVSKAVDLELLKTAFPFLVGWLSASALFGEYSPLRTLPKSLGAIVSSSAKTWAVGIPIGIIIRSLLKQQPPQVPFMVVSLVMTALFVTAWRLVFFKLIARGSGQGSVQ